MVGSNALHEIQRAIEALSPQELSELYAWLDEHYPESIGDEAWERSFRENPEKLHRLANEALEEHRRGETKPLP
jgi:hypothetical protein